MFLKVYYQTAAEQELKIKI